MPFRTQALRGHQPARPDKFQTSALTRLRKVYLTMRGFNHAGQRA